MCFISLLALQADTPCSSQKRSPGPGSAPGEGEEDCSLPWEQPGFSGERWPGPSKAGSRGEFLEEQGLRAPAEEERRSGRSRTPGRGASPCRAKGIAQDLALPRSTRAGARPPRAQQEDETGLSNLLFRPDLLSHFEFSLFLCFIG